MQEEPKGAIFMSAISLLLCVCMVDSSLMQAPKCCRKLTFAENNISSNVQFRKVKYENYDKLSIIS